MKKILWSNIPDRFWLWRHMGTKHRQGGLPGLDLTGPVWICSCGARREHH